MVTDRRPPVPLAAGQGGHLAVPAGANRAPDVFSRGLGFLRPVLSSRLCSESAPLNPSAEHPASGLGLLPAQQPSVPLDHTEPWRQLVPFNFLACFIPSLKCENQKEPRDGVVRVL